MTTIAVVAFNRPVADEWTARINELATMARPIGTDQQERIWTFLRERSEHAMINALAGTGKSFTMAYGTQCFDSPQVTALTCHSLGNGALYGEFGRQQPDGRKSYRIIDSLTRVLSQNAKAQAVKVAGLCKANLLDGRNPDELYALAAHHNIELNGDAAAIFDIMPELLTESTYVRRWGIDFDDMIWLPAILSLRPRRYDVLMVDEVQDLNRAQHALIMAAIAPPDGPTQQVVLGGKTYTATPAGRLIAVGDQHQAIYGFRGADAESMATLTATLAATPRGVTTFPLTMTRRCPVSVVKLAQQLVPSFQALPDAPQGEIGCNGDILKLEADQACPTCGYLKCQCPGGPLKWPTTPQRGDMVLCRTNAPLVKMAYKLLRDNVPAKIQGRDFGAGLATYITKLCKNIGGDDATVDALLQAMNAEQDKARTAIVTANRPDADTQLVALDDKADTIAALAEGCATAGDVKARIESVFADIEAGAPHTAFVLLSSVHRAKGMESDIVRILEPEKLPHPMARMPWEREQERNILYVAITRSKRTLIFHGEPNLRMPS